MRYGRVKISDVIIDGPDAGRFSFSFEPIIKKLAQSIEDVGLINPPSVRSRERGFDVVCGFKRVLACRTLGHTEIDALFYAWEGLSDEQCLKLNLIDNCNPCRLSPVECAIALNKFSTLGYDSKRLAREIAPKLGLPPSKRHVEKYLDLPSLNTEILHTVHEGSLGVEQAFCLQQLDDDSRSAVFHVVLACRVNLNETRELASLIPNVAAIEGIPAREYVDTNITPILEDTSLAPRRRLERIRNLLRRSRYPRLSETEAAFGATVEKLNLDYNCRITAPKHFEGDEISVTIRANTPEQLAQSLKKLSSADKKIEQLFAILRGRTE